jgi:6-hydroxynicotinate 3-monooxygenase
VITLDLHKLAAIYGLDDACNARVTPVQPDHASAFALYQTTRMPRVSKVQRVSAENSFLRHPTDPAWAFGYDATTVPLGPRHADDVIV